MALCCGHHGALACTLLGETFKHKQGCRTTNIEDGFQAFQRLQLHCIWCGGRWGSKNYQEIKRGAELIPLLRTVRRGGGGHDIISPPPPDNYCILPQLIFTVGLAWQTETHAWLLYFIPSQLFSVFIIKDCGRKGTERLWECTRQKNTPSLGENFPYVSPHAGQSQFQNPGNFCFWNHQSWALGSVIKLR